LGILKEYAKQRNMIYLETSAKTANQTTEAFVVLSKKLMQIKLKLFLCRLWVEMWHLNIQIRLQI